MQAGDRGQIDRVSMFTLVLSFSLTLACGCIFLFLAVSPVFIHEQDCITQALVKSVSAVGGGGIDWL